MWGVFRDVFEFVLVCESCRDSVCDTEFKRKRWFDWKFLHHFALFLRSHTHISLPLCVTSVCAWSFLSRFASTRVTDANQHFLFAVFCPEAQLDRWAQSTWDVHVKALQGSDVFHPLSSETHKHQLLSLLSFTDHFINDAKVCSHVVCTQERLSDVSEPFFRPDVESHRCFTDRCVSRSFRCSAWAGSQPPSPLVDI